MGTNEPTANSKQQIWQENGWMDLAYKEGKLYLTFTAGITDRLEVHLANIIIKRKPRGPKTVQNSRISQNSGWIAGKPD